MGDVDEAEFQAVLDHEERHWWYRGRLRVVRQQVARLNLPPGARILDAGCGSGRVLDELAQFGQVAGVDASPVAVTAAHRRGHVDVSLARVEELPFGDESFHLVTCLDVIEHTRDDTRALGELLRVTRPGGYLLVTAPAYPSLWSSHDDRNDHFRRYRRGTLRAVAANAGWQLDARHPLQQPALGARCRGAPGRPDEAWRPPTHPVGAFDYPARPRPAARSSRFASRRRSCGGARPSRRGSRWRPFSCGPRPRSGRRLTLVTERPPAANLA